MPSNKDDAGRTTGESSPCRRHSLSNMICFGIEQGHMYELAKLEKDDASDFIKLILSKKNYIPGFVDS